MGELEKLIDAAKSGAVEEVRAIVLERPDIINTRDDTGATPLHYAAFHGQRSVVQLLVQHGADINATDSRFGATPAGWAIEYMRELGGFLGIELNDFAHAIKRGDVEWTMRLLRRFPRLCQASDTTGTPFRILAEQSGNPEIVRLFGSGTDA